MKNVLKGITTRDGHSRRRQAAAASHSASHSAPSPERLQHLARVLAGYHGNPPPQPRSSDGGPDATP